MKGTQPVAGAAGSWPWRAWLIILATGAAILAPEFWTGPSTSDSLRYNIVWLDQWRDLVADGNLYPRWMPRSWDGLGSPAFYYYPPMFFWLATALDQLTLRLLETGTLISLTSALLLGASGLAMRAWLRAHVGSGAALLGALAYMIAPYHLYDIFARAALAETCAYAMLPLLMLTMKRAGEGDATTLPLLAVCYAALILSHLPVALLVSVVVLPAYAIFLTKAPARLAMLAAAGALGLGLASIYLVPALLLTDEILAQALSGSFYRPENWFFWRSGVGENVIMWIIIPACAAAALLAAVSARVAWRAGLREALFWCVLSLAAVLLITGMPPAFWRVPAIAQVQFPWRLLVVLEFAVVTGVALARPALRRPLMLLAAVPLSATMVLTVVIAAQRLDAARLRSAGDIATIRAIYRDAPEYLPAGWPVPLGPDGIPNPSLVRLPQVPLVQAGPDAKGSVAVLRDGGLIVEVKSTSPTMIVARRFSHGAWGVSDEKGNPVRSMRTPDHLVRWQAPAGHSLFRLSLGQPMEAFDASIISLLSLLVLLLWSFKLRERQRPRRSLKAAA